MGELEEEIDHKHDDHTHKASRVKIVFEEANNVRKVETKKRTAYQNAVLRLAGQLRLYSKIKTLL